MKLFIEPVINCYWHRHPNFGDAMTELLVRELSGFKAAYVGLDQDCLKLAMCGSTLADLRPPCVVWGCGIGQENQTVAAGLDIRAVRGPLSLARAQESHPGLACGVGDVASLLPLIWPRQPTGKYELGVVPHYTDYRCAVGKFWGQRNIRIVDVMNPFERVVDDICACRAVISSSLHGLIVAHAYGIPALWVKFGDGVIGGGFKFRDYFESVNIKPYAQTDAIEPMPASLSAMASLMPVPNHAAIRQSLLSSCPVQIVRSFA